MLGHLVTDQEQSVAPPGALDRTGRDTSVVRVEVEDLPQAAFEERSRPVLSLRVRVPPVDHHLVRRPPQDAPHAVQGLDASNASMGAAGREVKDPNHGWGVEVRPCLARRARRV